MRVQINYLIRRTWELIPTHPKAAQLIGTCSRWRQMHFLTYSYKPEQASPSVYSLDPAIPPHAQFLMSMLLMTPNNSRGRLSSENNQEITSFAHITGYYIFAPYMQRRGGSFNVMSMWLCGGADYEKNITNGHLLACMNADIMFTGTNNEFIMSYNTKLATTILFIIL
jgi:hypothetical protein